MAAARVRGATRRRGGPGGGARRGLQRAARAGAGIERGTPRWNSSRPSGLGRERRRATSGTRARGARDAPALAVDGGARARGGRGGEPSGERRVRRRHGAHARCSARVRLVVVALSDARARDPKTRARVGRRRRRRSRSGSSPTTGDRPSRSTRGAVRGRDAACTPRRAPGVESLRSDERARRRSFERPEPSPLLRVRSGSRRPTASAFSRRGRRAEREPARARVGRPPRAERGTRAGPSSRSEDVAASALDARGGGRVGPGGDDPRASRALAGAPRARASAEADVGRGRPRPRRARPHRGASRRGGAWRGYSATAPGACWRRVGPGCASTPDRGDAVIYGDGAGGARSTRCAIEEQRESDARSRTALGATNHQRRGDHPARGVEIRRAASGCPRRPATQASGCSGVSSSGGFVALRFFAPLIDAKRVGGAENASVASGVRRRRSRRTRHSTHGERGAGQICAASRSPRAHAVHATMLKAASGSRAWRRCRSPSADEPSRCVTSVRWPLWSWRRTFAESVVKRRQHAQRSPRGRRPLDGRRKNRRRIGDAALRRSGRRIVAVARRRPARRRRKSSRRHRHRRRTSRLPRGGWAAAKQHGRQLVVGVGAYADAEIVAARRTRGARASRRDADWSTTARRRQPALGAVDGAAGEGRRRVGGAEVG